MKDPAGRVMVLLGDMTDHEGTVIEAAAEFSEDGTPVALDGHLVLCPRCGGPFPIIATGYLRFAGKRVAFAGDKTACGATLIHI
ncbi:PAAR domain-containing protein [Burkholderia pyrrocinia]|uniref:PAAR domain-containing protein n=1 Tax=Burkholderia pyrrocinia TaxID=60550 RepID=UPI00158E5E04|nr:PAAR domain-containing protein [Burkholderia pyrrocinia]